MRVYRDGLKRLLDAATSTVALVILAPVIGVVAVLVRLRLGTPVLFRQERPGWRSRPFVLVKFRTMRDVCRADGSAIPDEDRLTPFGCRLRAWSIDELPTLWNVLKGEMSLIGPRPLLMQYLTRYSSLQTRRHEVRPGMTGWTQVNGRNALSWEDKFRLDVWYVDHVSFALDVRIVLRTVASVLRREGIAADGHATMPEFMGNEVDGGGPVD